MIQLCHIKQEKCPYCQAVPVRVCKEPSRHPQSEYWAHRTEEWVTFACGYRIHANAGGMLTIKAECPHLDKWKKVFAARAAVLEKLRNTIESAGGDDTFRKYLLDKLQFVKPEDCGIDGVQIGYEPFLS